MPLGNAHLLLTGGTFEKTVIPSLAHALLETIPGNSAVVPEIQVLLILLAALCGISGEHPKIPVHHQCKRQETENTKPGKQTQ